MKAGKMIEYACPKTEARHCGLLAAVGRKVATVVPLTAGRVVVIRLPLDRILRDQPMSKTKYLAWVKAVRRQGNDYGITKGAKRALTQARKAVS